MLNLIKWLVYRDALRHGLWREEDTLLDGAQMVCAEAVELAQEAAKDSVTPELQEELADVIIMCLSFAGRFNVDVWRAVWRKIKKNKRRAWRHEE
jgi:NTP pyrophosphatase (non-canonical NTP hydrolase)